MEIFRYKNIENFLELALPVLCKNETENNLILGISLTIKNFPDKYIDAYLAVVKENEYVFAIVVCTPPHKLLFWFQNDRPEKEINLIISDFIKTNYQLNGILGYKEHAMLFANQWKLKFNGKFRKGMWERIYRLDEVAVPTKVNGCIRLADINDLDLVSSWMMEFSKAAIPDDPMTDFRELSEAKIKNKDIVLWRNGENVSIASRARPTQNGITINMVYTPPKFRRNGYATILVAELSNALLSEGWKYITLFTDMSNPTSNSIYQKIGFKRVCDFQEYFFETN